MGFHKIPFEVNNKWFSGNCEITTYTLVVEKAPTYKQFVRNMELKLQDPEFLDDTDILLSAGSDKFDPRRAYAMVKNAFIDKLPGKRD